MSHGGGRRGAVPMFFPRREPDDIAGTNLLDGATPTLDSTTARRHDQRLPQRVGVPGGSCPWFKGDTGTAHPRRIGGLEERVDAHRAGKIVARSLAGGCEPLRLISIC